MPKESSITKAVLEKGTENLAPTSSTSSPTKEVERTENMVPTSIEGLNMMDYSAAQNKNPIHN